MASPIPICLPNPIDNWKKNGSVLWALVNNESFSTSQINSNLRQELRVKVISDNLFSREPTVYSLEPIRIVKREKVYSHAAIFLHTLQIVCRKGFINVARNLVEVVVFLFFITISAVCIKIAIKPPISSFNIFISLVGLLQISAFWLGALASHLDNPNSLMNVHTFLNELNKAKFAVEQPIHIARCSSNDFDLKMLANEKTEEGWIDPLSKRVIREQDIHSPSILIVGKHAIPIETLLFYILSKSPSRSEFTHPIENRPLTAEEQSKFLTDVCNLFSISKQNFLDCWNEQEAAFRIKKFLELIPESVVNQHLQLLKACVRLEENINR